MHHWITIRVRCVVLTLAFTVVLAACGGGDGSHATYTLGGSITGLTSGGLALSNAGSTVTPVANSNSFTFATSLDSASAYSIAIQTQPAGQTCVVSNGSGIVASANITNVAVTCTLNSYSVGGSIVGLTAAGLLLANGDDMISPAANDTSFSFSSKVAYGSGYAVIANSHPPGQDCQVANGTGIMRSAAVTDVTITCMASQWKWMSGADIAGAFGVYGIQGTGVDGNVPGGRSGARSWTDASGNMWLFGGLGEWQSSNGNTFIQGTGYLNDLWQYKRATGLWTWMKGSQISAAPSVGTLGIAAPGNTPAGRAGSAAWTDDDGNLWLFGGHSIQYSSSVAFNVTFENSYADLWRYNSNSGQWVMIAARATSYGSQGVVAASNQPGCRHDAMFWKDNAGNFWLFGGYGCDSTSESALSGITIGSLNDLWKYDPHSGDWTWMSGSNLASAAGVYGMQGVTDAANVPGARYAGAAWADSVGNLWLFGGMSSTTDSSGTVSTQYFNDLWKYSLSTGQWTWVGGFSTPDVAGVYGAQGTAASINIPGARANTATWIGSDGNFWLFGGDNGTAYFNDLWSYSPQSGQWTWIKGSNVPNVAGIFGTQGSATVTNAPGARSGATPWRDASGALWLFGGYGYDSAGTLGYLNDLWKL